MATKKPNEGKTTELSVVPKAKMAPTTLSPEGEAAYKNQPLEMQNILLPKVLIMQGMSDLVTAGKALFLEIRETLGGALLAKPGETLEIIPFKSETVWIEYEKEGDKRKFTGIVPVTPANERLPYEEIVGNKKIIRVYSIDMYCILPNQIASGSDLPHVVAFRSTSLRVGKQAYTLSFVRNRRMNRDPWARVLKVSSVKSSNEKGTFGIWHVEDSREATQVEMDVAKHWSREVNAGRTIVDNSDVEATKDEEIPLAKTDQF